MIDSLTTLPLSTLLNARKISPPLTKQTQSALDQFPGLRTGPRRGQGLEFDDLRQYLAGDDIRHIDWNVTARTGEPHTRIYREEREHTTTAIIDLRPCMFTGSNVLLAVRAGELAATTLWQAMRRGDRCSAVTISANGIQATRPVSGNQGVLAACELIADQFSIAHSSLSNTSMQQSELELELELESLFDWLNQAGRRTGVKLLFSNFAHSPSSVWPSKLKAAGIKQTLVGVLLLDAMESDGVLAGNYYYKPGYSSNTNSLQINLNSDTAKQVHALLEEALKALRAVFLSAHIPLLEIDTRRQGSSLLAELTAQQIV